MTCCGAEGRTVLALGLASLLALACASGGPQPAPRRTAVDLTNPFLGPEHSQFLVGAVSALATSEEVQAFLALRDDAAAVEFVRLFWERRDPAPDRPGNPFLEVFEERGVVADRLYTEAGYAGRRTARGALFVLYGQPKSVEFELPPRAGERPIEVWTYGAGAPAGLTGRAPEPVYRFVKQGDLTVPYSPLARTLRPRVSGLEDQ